MRILSKFFFCIVVISSLAACSGGKLAPADYVRYMHDGDNGLIKEKTMGELSFTASYLTKEYLACKSAFIANNIDVEKLKAAIANTGDYTYLKISIRSQNERDPFYAGKRDETIYNQRMAYANTAIINDFKLEVNDVVQDCKFVSFEPTHSISNEIVFALVFDKTDLNMTDSDVKLIYDDKLFGLGIMKFNFNLKDIKNIPILKI